MKQFNRISSNNYITRYGQIIYSYVVSLTDKVPHIDNDRTTGRYKIFTI